MKFLPIAAGLAGLAVIAALLTELGIGGVLDALMAVGWLGFALICCIHLGLIGVMGVAWRALLPATNPLTLMWGRLVRDSGSEILPLSQVGGYVLGARAVAIAGIGATVAAASTMVDVTLEFLAQVAYTAIGLGWLVYLRPGTAVAVPVAIGLPVAVLAGAAFVAVQRQGFALFDRLARLIGHGWINRTAAGAAAMHAVLGDIYRRQSGLGASFLLHLGCWIASGLEVWIALRLAGAPLGFDAVLVIESLVYATRTIAFIIPNALGVQEGAYVLIGATFGLTPDMALALSLLKRARDFALGLPTLGVWQAQEGGRLWRREASHAAAPDSSGGIDLVIPHQPVDDE